MLRLSARLLRAKSSVNYPPDEVSAVEGHKAPIAQIQGAVFLPFPLLHFVVSPAPVRRARIGAPWWRRRSTHCCDISEELEQRWTRMIGFRNILVHDKLSDEW